MQGIFAAQGWPTPPLETVPDRSFNDCRYSVSSDKLQALGWQPRVTLEQGLCECFAWYEAHRSRYQHLDLAAHPTAHPDLSESTSAVRDASNGIEFIERVEDATGIRLDVLSGMEEAVYIGRGLRCDPQVSALDDFVQMDIGGGSLEPFGLATTRFKMPVRCNWELSV